MSKSDAQENLIENLITCPICLNRYDFSRTKPKILPKCSHTFCLNCLVKLTDGKSIMCPNDRLVNIVPIDGVEGLQNNLTIMSLLDLKECSLCKTMNNSMFKCKYCNKSFCRACNNSHIINEIKENGERTISEIKQFQPTLTEKLIRLENDKLQVKQNCDSVKNDINQTFEKLIDELKKRKENLNDEVDVYLKLETKLIDNQMETIQIEYQISKELSDSAERSLSKLNENMSNENIEKLINECVKALDSLKLNEKKSSSVDKLTVNFKTNEFLDKINKFGDFEKKGQTSSEKNFFNLKNFNINTRLEWFNSLLDMFRKLGDQTKRLPYIEQASNASKTKPTK